MLNNIAAYYSPVYLILVAIFSLRIVRKYKRLYSIRNYQYPSSGSRDFIIVTLLTLIIGTRPISGKYFVDMAGYADHYVRYLGEKFILIGMQKTCCLITCLRIGIATIWV